MVFSSLKVTIMLALVISVTGYSVGQNVGINTTGATPDASAILDVTAPDKGILIPRLSTAQRVGVTTPANALMVFDTNTQSFWFYNAATPGWEEIGASGDDLGNHIATQNVELDGNWLSNDGDNEGVAVDNAGNVGVGTATPSRLFTVAGVSGPPGYTADLTGTGTASASSVLNTSSWDASFAVNNLATPNWSSAANSALGWWMYDFGAGNNRTIARYTIAGTNDFPTDWNFQGSNDGVSFTTLHTVTGNASAALGTPNVYTFANATAYRYYRMDITASSDPQYSELMNVEMMEEIPSTPVDLFTVSSVGEVRVNDNYTLPQNDGTANQVLTTDGAGAVSWQTASAGGSLGAAIAIPYATGWSAYGGAFLTPSFYIDGNGIVHLQGLLAHAGSNSAGDIIGVLPVGYRPTAIQIYSVHTSVGEGRLDVHPDGTMYLYFVTATFVSLNGVYFRTN